MPASHRPGLMSGRGGVGGRITKFPGQEAGWEGTGSCCKVILSTGTNVDKIMRKGKQGSFWSRPEDSVWKRPQDHQELALAGAVPSRQAPPQSATSSSLELQPTMSATGKPGKELGGL